jgi:hypothetical protein
VVPDAEQKHKTSVAELSIGNTILFAGINATAEARLVPVPKSVMIRGGGVPPATVTEGTKFACETVRVILWPMESIGEYAWICTIFMESLDDVTPRALLTSPDVRFAPEALLTRTQRLIHLLPPDIVAGGSPGADLNRIRSSGGGGAIFFLFFFEDGAISNFLQIKID